MKRTISCSSHFLVHAIAGMFLVIMMFSGIVYAIDDASPPYMDPSRILSSAQQRMKILKKTPESVLAAGTRFIVIPETVIEMGGDPLSFKEMPVPCSVVGYYETQENQDPVLVKIDIQGVAADASTDWAPTMPE